MLFSGGIKKSGDGKMRTQQLQLGQILLLAPHQDGYCQAKVGLQQRNLFVVFALRLLICDIPLSISSAWCCNNLLAQKRIRVNAEQESAFLSLSLCSSLCYLFLPASARSCSFPERHLPGQDKASLGREGAQQAGKQANLSSPLIGD